MHNLLSSNSAISGLYVLQVPIFSTNDSYVFSKFLRVLQIPLFSKFLYSLNPPPTQTPPFNTCLLSNNISLSLWKAFSPLITPPQAFSAQSPTAQRPSRLKVSEEASRAGRCGVALLWLYLQPELLRPAHLWRPVRPGRIGVVGRVAWVGVVSAVWLSALGGQCAASASNVCPCAQVAAGQQHEQAHRHPHQGAP